MAHGARIVSRLTTWLGRQCRRLHARVLAARIAQLDCTIAELAIERQPDALQLAALMCRRTLISLQLAQVHRAAVQAAAPAKRAPVLRRVV